MEEKKKKISFNKLILYFNIFFSFFLLIIYVSIETDPLKYGYFSLLSLLYSPILLINLIFIFYWIIIKKPYFLLSTICVLIGYNNIQKQIQFFGENQNNPQNHIKIISFNTRNFVHNGWEERNRQLLKENLIKILNQENPDIICLQEFPDTINIKLDTEYKINQKLGTIILTSKKQINNQFVHLETNRSNSCIYIDIIHEKDTIRVYNMHLESVQINKKDSFFQKITKINEANKIRIKQVKTIINNIKKSPYPVILCGDMNNSPYSFAYKNITKQLNDAFIKSGSGLGNTFQYIIPLRIDYIFHEKNIKSYNFNTINTNLSDHNMITCNIFIN